MMNNEPPVNPSVGYAIRRPSGDHAGKPPAARITGFPPPPFRRRTTPTPPPPDIVYVSALPSGDHIGSTSCSDGVAVTRCTGPPSSGNTYRSREPDRQE